MNDLAKALRLLRVFHDISQTQLADSLEVSKSFLSEIESGKKEPTLQMLSRYAEEFGIPRSSLLFFAERISGSAPSDASRKFAPKVLKLLDWIAATEESSSVTGKKPPQRQTSIEKNRQRFGS